MSSSEWDMKLDQMVTVLQELKGYKQGSENVDASCSGIPFAKDRYVQAWQKRDQILDHAIYLPSDF